MSQNLAVIQGGSALPEKLELGIEELKSRMVKIDRLMKEVLQKNIHYGRIPGCGDKPALFKSGAEKIAAMFMLGIKPVVEEIRFRIGNGLTDHIRYRVTAEVHHVRTGEYLGSGIGECSTAEDKYRWERIDKSNWDKADPDKRRVKQGKYTTYQVEGDPYSKLNTVLKMAKKRAMVDAILTVTGASDIFTQDVEDFLDEDLESEATPVANASHESKGNGKGPFAGGLDRSVIDQLVKIGQKVMAQGSRDDWNKLVASVREDGKACKTSDLTPAQADDLMMKCEHYLSMKEQEKKEGGN